MVTKAKRKELDAKNTSHAPLPRPSPVNKGEGERQAPDSGAHAYEAGVEACRNGKNRLEWPECYGEESIDAWLNGWDTQHGAIQARAETFAKVADVPKLDEPRILRTIDYTDPQLTPVEEAELCDTIADMRASVPIVAAHASILKHGLERRSNMLNKGRLAQASRLLRNALDTFDASLAKLPFA